MISDQVHEVIMDFYEASKHLHITLDEETVAKKMLRIYDKVNDLGKYATCCNTARLKLKWKQNGYKECIIENFHFAFQIYQDENALKRRGNVSESIRSSSLPNRPSKPAGELYPDRKLYVPGGTERY